MTNSNSPYQNPYDKGQQQNPEFMPASGHFQASPPYQNQANNNANVNPYHNTQQSEYSLPPELNPRDKEEYFRMWRGFSYIPRPAIIWLGGLLAAVAICSVVSWNDMLYELFNSVFSTAWIVFGIVGTISFKQGVKQIFVFYPHLATSEKKMIEMRKIARLRVGYTYQDTFSHMWKNMATLLSGIFTSSAGNNGAGHPAQGHANYASTPNQATPPVVPENYDTSPYGVSVPEATAPATSEPPSEESKINLNKETN